MRALPAVFLAMILTACGGGGGRMTPATGAANASANAAASQLSGTNPAPAPREAYVAYADHIAIYPLTASGCGCPARTITGLANAGGIAIGDGMLYVLLRAAPNAAFSQVEVFDAATASGAALPLNTTFVRNDGSGAITYAPAVPAVFETGHDASRPLVASFPPSPALQNGGPQQNRSFTGGGSTLAVAPDGTVYAGAGGGVNVYAPNAADFSNPPDPNYRPAQPSGTIGNAGAASTPVALARDTDGTLYIASAPVANPAAVAIDVYPPGSTSPARSLAIGAVTSLALDPSGDLLVIHGALLETFAPGASGSAVPIRTLKIAATTAGPSALALGP